MAMAIPFRVDNKQRFMPAQDFDDSCDTCEKFSKRVCLGI